MKKEDNRLEPEKSLTKEQFRWIKDIDENINCELWNQAQYDTFKLGYSIAYAKITRTMRMKFKPLSFYQHDLFLEQREFNEVCEEIRNHVYNTKRFKTDQD